MLEVFRRFGSIQFDPLAVAGRTHDLVLHARVAEYDPAWCDLLYERREIFEAYNKGLSFVLATEYPWFRATLSRSESRVLEENAEVAGRVLERIRADGPLSSLDFERAQGPTTDWFGVPTNTVRAVLEAYAVTGVLGLARRDGNRRYYDLLERLLPADVLARSIPLREQLRHKLLSRYRAHGLLGVGGGGGVFGGIGPAKPDPRLPEYPGRTALREELIDDGELVPVEIEGVRGKRFVLEGEVGLLDDPPEPPPSVAFLPPFDALVWDRALLGSLFEFDYVWELFLPPAKRRWGWYVLPMLFRDRLVGRIEPRIDRAAGGAGARPLVGGRLRAATHRGLRRRDARRAPRLPAVRRRDSARVAVAPRDGETALRQSSLGGGQRVLEGGPVEGPAVRREHVLDRQLEQRAQPLGDLFARHLRAKPPLVDLEPLTEVDERVARDHRAMAFDPEHGVVRLVSRKHVCTEWEPVTGRVHMCLALALAE